MILVVVGAGVMNAHKYNNTPRIIKKKQHKKKKKKKRKTASNNHDILKMTLKLNISPILEFI